MMLGPEDQTPQEREFGYAMIDLYEKTGKQTKYWANYFLRSVRKHGVVAAKRVLQADKPDSKPSKGFMTLLHMARLDLTLEREILRPKWDGLSTDEERDFCRRLADYGYRH
jgi:5-methylcytosine-specific restriction enzyme A